MTASLLALLVCCVSHGTPKASYNPVLVTRSANKDFGPEPNALQHGNTAPRNAIRFGSPGYLLVWVHLASSNCWLGDAWSF